MKGVAGCYATGRVPLEVVVIRCQEQSRESATAIIEITTDGHAFTELASMHFVKLDALECRLTQRPGQGAVCPTVYDVRTIVVEHCLRVASRNSVKTVDVIDSSESGVSLFTGALYHHVVHQNGARFDVPLTTSDGVVLSGPTVPCKLLLRQIRVRVAGSEDKKQWNGMILSTSAHNIGGSEALADAWKCALKLVAVDSAGTIVGLVCMSCTGWIPYITSAGSPHSGLGAFLLFLSMEWFRLNGGRTVGLTPADDDAFSWYKEWGFTLKPDQPASAKILRRHIGAHDPLLPSPFHTYVSGLDLSKRPTSSYKCILCMKHLSAACCPEAAGSKLFESATQLLRHVERHHFQASDSGNTPEQSLMRQVLGDCLGVRVCSSCESGFDIHECGVCNRCWNTKRKRHGAE